MEEFVIPIYSSRDMPLALISQYPLAVQVDAIMADIGDDHNLALIPELNMIDISKQGIIDALDYRPARNDGVVVPRLLDITLHAYDCKRSMRTARNTEFATDTEWMKWAIEDRMDVQPLKILIDDHYFINHQLFNCNVKAKFGNVDTIYYDLHPLEKKEKKCNHMNIELMRSLTMTEMFHVLQGAAYTLKTNYTLTATAERQDISHSFENVGLRWQNLAPNTRIENRGSAYDKFIAGLVQVRIDGKCPNEITAELNQLRSVKEKWVGAQYQGNAIYAHEICSVMSAIGRKMLNAREEPVDEEGISRRFQQEIDDVFSQMNRENVAVRRVAVHANDEQKFFALMVIAATDVNQGRIWRTNPYPCLRGTLIAAECALGDVYSAMRRIFSWSVRPTYGTGEKQLENNRYVYSRINLFESNISVDEEVIHWRYELLAPAETTYDRGYICSVERGDDDLLCKIDDAAYKLMFDEAVRVGWQQHTFKLYKMLTEPNLLTIDFEKDAYLGPDSSLVMPDYYNKWIRSPMFNARLRLTKARINAEKTGDPWNDRVVGGTIKTPVESLGYTLGRFYDLRLQFVEDVLSYRQQQSAIFQYMGAREDFAMLTHYARGERDICPHAGGTLYITRRVALEVLTSYERLDPQYHHGREHLTYCHPSIDYTRRERIFEIEDLAQLICYVIDYIFEKRDSLREVGEARRIVYLIQSVTGIRRHEVLNQAFPRFFAWFLRLKNVEVIRDLNIVNFLPLLFLVRDNISYQHRQWSVPMILYDQTIKLIPVEVGAYANRVGFKSFFNFVQFHPGDAQKRQEADESHKKMGQICYAYYTDTTISQGKVDTPVIATKMDTLRVHLAAVCAGLSDSLVYALPVAHPERCIVLIIIGDEKLDPNVRTELVVSRYRYSRKHIRGAVSICMYKNGQFRVHTTGIVRHRICEKTILNFRCRAILVRTPGYVFGNDELMTKLLNV
ncbi:outer capsid protein VP2 [Bluetongue virus]|uniref:Outer capsid protein VP2 n=1 Tax=Bluetongue virus TaxID=40051 RepID=F4ZDR3_BTV|nr:outer capsid protein VP2 [Bluetongue virus]